MKLSWTLRSAGCADLQGLLHGGGYGVGRGGGGRRRALDVHIPQLPQEGGRLEVGQQQHAAALQGV